MYVRAGRPVFARPYVGVHKSTLLMTYQFIILFNFANLYILHETFLFFFDITDFYQ